MCNEIGFDVLTNSQNDIDHEEPCLNTSERNQVRARFTPQSIVILGSLVAYLVVALLVFGRFETKNWYPVTGDEPHYLIMASGIIHDGTLDQTLPYEQEFQSRAIYPPGFAPRNATTSPANAAVFPGPHGLYNYHDAGLPILLVPGFYLGSVLGSKIEMVLLLGLIAIGSGWLATRVAPKRTVALLIALSVTLGLPLLASASQIYPDMLNGAICLVLIVSYIVGRREKSYASYLVIAIFAGIEPWLHIKFLAPSLLIVGAFSIFLVRARRFYKLLFFLGIYFIFLAVLAYYNLYAFGSIGGPYTGGVNVGLKGTVMAFIGLLIDRHQGIFAQQPLLLLGAFWVVRSMVKRESWAWLTALVVGGIIIPGAAFTNVYGGYSFAGRFEWGASAVLIAPTVLCLTRLYEKRAKLFYTLIFAALGLQAMFGLEYLSSRFDFYNVVGNQWAPDYPSLWGPLSKFMPALYDPTWAFRFAPNYIGAALLFVVLLAGLFRWYKSLLVATVILFGILGVVGIFGNVPTPPLVFTGAGLPSQVGTITGQSRLASNATQSGVLTFGPYVSIGSGRYSFQLTYFASQSTLSTSSWDLVCGSANSTSLTTIATGVFAPGQLGSNELVQKTFVIQSSVAPCLIQIQTNYAGKGTLVVRKLQLDLIS